jgi:hypothetical protein
MLWGCGDEAIQTKQAAFKPFFGFLVVHYGRFINSRTDMARSLKYFYGCKRNRVESMKKPKIKTNKPEPIDFRCCFCGDVAKTVERHPHGRAQVQRKPLVNFAMTKTPPPRGWMDYEQ